MLVVGVTSRGYTDTVNCLACFEAKGGSMCLPKGAYPMPINIDFQYGSTKLSRIATRSTPTNFIRAAEGEETEQECLFPPYWQQRCFDNFLEE
jgi:hypothetical protein